MFSEITSAINFFWGNDNQSGPLSGKKERSLAEMLAEADSHHFLITAKQFAHRMVPAYLDKTEIVGISSLMSVSHWIRLIELWLESKALFLPHQISTSHLQHLLNVLKDYQKTLERNASLTDENCRECAQLTLKEIKEKLPQQKTLYIPLGYRQGPRNGGHAITLKICDRGKEIEAVFLNLGEGAQMHPQVGWTVSGPRFHFQSFPVRITKSTLASPLAEECFTRLAHLKIDPCPAEVRGYHAEDVYGPIYSLGTIQSTFNDSLDKRSAKPQLGDICGDMAIVLLIKDVLIDLGYDKEQIHQFFSLEKFCNILFFYSHLSQSEKGVDEWVLLKNGLKEFSIRLLKDDAKGRRSEFAFLNPIFHLLFLHVEHQIQTKIKKSIPLDVLKTPVSSKSLFFNCKEKAVNPNAIAFRCPALQNLSAWCCAPSIGDLNPRKIKEKLTESVAYSQRLQKTQQRDKANRFVFRLFCCFDIPHYTQKGFWDEVPEGELCEIIESMTKLAYLGVQRDSSYDPRTLIFPDAMILSIGYAITDRLIRRKYPTLFENFASPFFPSRWELSYTSIMGNFHGWPELNPKKDFFEFWMLPTAAMNTRWSQIRDYFEQQQRQSHYTLFALDQDNIDIAGVVDDMQKLRLKLSRTWSSEQQHLKFLEQFLDPESPLSLKEEYEALWLNYNNQLPKEIEFLHFFAHYSWFTFLRQSVTIQDEEKFPEIPKRLASKDDEELEETPKSITLIDQYLGANFNESSQIWIEGNKKSENESQCFQPVDKSSFSQPWNPKHYRDWLRIFSNRSLQISSVILWIDNNLTLLSDSHMQKMVEEALFMPGLLDKKIRQEPSTLNQLRKLIKRGLDYYRNQLDGTNGLLFLLRLGICIESFSPQQSKKALGFYENFLLDAIGEKESASFHLLLLFLYQIGLPRESDSLKELIKSYFWIKYHEPVFGTAPWLTYEIQNPLESHRQQLMECLHQQSWAEEIVAKLWASIIPDLPLPEVSCQTGYPFIQKGKFAIHIEEGILLKNGEQQLFYIDKQHQLLCPQLNANGLIWLGKEALFSPSGEIIITPSVNQVGYIIKKKFFSSKKTAHFQFKEIFKELQIESHDLWFTQIDSPEFFKHALFEYPGFDYWELDTPKKKEGRLIIISKEKTAQPLYLIYHQFPQEQISIFKIDSDGTLGHQLLNILNESPAASWFKRLGYQYNACIWINPENQRCEEIDFLSPWHPITFKREKELFFSAQFPGYYLAEEQTLEILNGFEGTIILQKENQKYLFLPYNILHRDNQNFSTTVTFKQGELSFQKYYIYQIDEITDTLVHSEPEANFFLTLLFALQRNYKEALFYLNRSTTFDSYNKNMATIFSRMHSQIEQITSLEDHSPEALLFYLRLFLHFVKNSQQINHDLYRSPSDWVFTPMKKEWISERFSKYLRIHSDFETSRIPNSMRLAEEEEIYLLEYLKIHLTQEDQKIINRSTQKYSDSLPEFMKKSLRSSLYWTKSFDNRLFLLRYRKWQGQITAQKYLLCASKSLLQSNVLIKEQLNSFPPNLKKGETPLQKDFVRLTFQQIVYHFMELYAIAQTGKSPLSFFYLDRNDSEASIAYLQVLHYVHKYPSQFQSLNFGDDLATNQEVFNQILEKVVTTFARYWSNASDIHKVWSQQTLYFNYRKNLSLALPDKPSFEKLKWKISNPDKREHLLDMQQALFLHFQSWFQILQQPLFSAETPFAFSQIASHSNSQPVQKWLKIQKRGHQKLLDPKNGTTCYQLKEGKSIQHCLFETKQLLKNKRDELIGIKQKTEMIANSYPEAALRLRLRKSCCNLSKITIEGLLSRAYQMQNPQIIQEANPSLNRAQIERLIANTIKYHLLKIEIRQLEQAIVALEKGSIQDFVEALIIHQPFNPIENPEITLYQSIEKKKLRKVQADLLKWELESCSEKKRLFSIPAGAGKTTLYIPVAMQRIQRTGQVPFSISSKPLYLVDREGLKESSQQIFASELNILEINLSTRTASRHFKNIYEQLSLRGKDSGFKLTAEAYYALHLKYQLALENRNCESVKWLSQIFHFFETRGVALVDECRMNCTPFTQAKIGIGRPHALPEIDRKIFIEIYRLLLSEEMILPNQLSIKKTVGLDRNLQACMNRSERMEVKKSLIQALVCHPLFNIPLEEQRAIGQYWLNEKEEPGWLKKIGGEQARSIDVVKIYFDVFFKKSMNLVWRMQHVRSIRKGEEIHVPAKARQATNAYFEEAYIALLATIQGTIQQGLDLEQVRMLLKMIEADAMRKRDHLGKKSEIENKLKKWIGKSEAALPLHHISYQKLTEKDALYQRLYKNEDAIFWYLEHVVLTQIQSPPEQLSVTPVYFNNGFNQITFFSADTGPKEIYGIFKRGAHVHTNRLFIPEAIHQFVAPQNQNFLTFSSPQSPYHFFQSLRDLDPDLFSHLRMICDAGGTLRNFTADELVSGFFQFLKKEPQFHFDGVIFFEESSDKESETELLLWLKDWSKPKLIKGHDIPKALQSMGHNWQSMNLLTIIDPSHRVGANIEQRPDTTILVLLGEDLTLSNTVQAALRGRGVLSGKQRLFWGIEHKLAHKFTSSHPTIFQALSWTAKNEIKYTEEELLLSAYQQIDYHVASHAWNLIKKQRDQPEQQIEIWHKYRKGFVKPGLADLVKRFKEKKGDVLTEAALWDYAKKEYQRFSYSTSWEKATTLHATLKPIIAMVPKEIVLSSKGEALGMKREIYIHTHQKQEVKKDLMTTAHTNLQPSPFSPLPDWLTLDRSHFVDYLKKYSHRAVDLFQSKGLSSQLWFTDNSINTATTSDNFPLKEDYLKAIQYLLVIKKDSKWCAFALADGEAEFFQKQLIALQLYPFQCALLSGNGKMVQNGGNLSAFTPQDLKTNFIKDILIDVGLTHCQLIEPQRFMERVDSWYDFWPMWEKIKKAQPQLLASQIKWVEKHVPNSIKNYKKSQK